MKSAGFNIFIRLVALAFSTMPPTAATLLYFPLWRSEGAATLLSGTVLLLLLISLMPIGRVLKRFLRSPAVHTVWFIAFIFFFALSRIADELTVISFVGFIGNIIGALLFKLADILSAVKKESQDEERI